MSTEGSIIEREYIEAVLALICIEMELDDDDYLWAESEHTIALLQNLVRQTSSRVDLVRSIMPASRLGELERILDEGDWEDSQDLCDLFEHLPPDEQRELADDTDEQRRYGFAALGLFFMNRALLDAFEIEG